MNKLWHSPSIEKSFTSQTKTAFSRAKDPYFLPEASQHQAHRSRPKSILLGGGSRVQVPKVPIKEGRVEEIKGSWAGREQEGMEGMWRVAGTFLLLPATNLTISGTNPPTLWEKIPQTFKQKLLWVPLRVRGQVATLKVRQEESGGCIATLCSPRSISWWNFYVQASSASFMGGDISPPACSTHSFVTMWWQLLVAITWLP